MALRVPILSVLRRLQLWDGAESTYTLSATVTPVVGWCREYPHSQRYNYHHQMVLSPQPPARIAPHRLGGIGSCQHLTPTTTTKGTLDLMAIIPLTTTTTATKTTSSGCDKGGLPTSPQPQHQQEKSNKKRTGN